MQDAHATAPAPEHLMPDLVCFSHLRWNFVYQRPQHLMSRFAERQRVFFVEEPLFDAETAHLDVQQVEVSLWVAVPHLPANRADPDAAQRTCVNELLRRFGIEHYVAWYYTALALTFTRHLHPLTTVYDCMDELSAFRGASPALLECETELLRRADLVFAGGRSLFEAKQDRHAAVHLFPSSIDAAHFGRARTPLAEAPEQAHVPHPRLGYFGVIDERMDLALLAEVADARPDWQLVLVGPWVKIEWEELPKRPNIHYVGGAAYEELPAFVAGWDVALIPFARNGATRFLSPTKTPEYLAAGTPVVSTPIRDVVRAYGDLGLVRIASTSAEWISAVEATLAETPTQRAAWLTAVDEFLRTLSWDRTWAGMAELIDDVVQANTTSGSRGAAQSGVAVAAAEHGNPSKANV